MTHCKSGENKLIWAKITGKQTTIYLFLNKYMSRAKSLSTSNTFDSSNSTFIPFKQISFSSRKALHFCDQPDSNQISRSLINSRVSCFKPKSKESLPRTIKCEGCGCRCWGSYRNTQEFCQVEWCLQLLQQNRFWEERQLKSMTIFSSSSSMSLAAPRNLTYNKNQNQNQNQNGHFQKPCPLKHVDVVSYEVVSESNNLVSRIQTWWSIRFPSSPEIPQCLLCLWPLEEGLPF